MFLFYVLVFGLFFSQLEQSLEVDALWSLNRQTKRTIPDELCQWA